MIEKVVDEYTVTADDVTAKVEIKHSSNEFVQTYNLIIPQIEKGTLALLDKVRENLTAQIPIKSTEIFDLSVLEDFKEKIYNTGLEILKH